MPSNFRSDRRFPLGAARRLSLVAAVAVLVLVAAAPPAWALRTQSDLVLIRPTDVIDEDLYALGNRVQIDGRVEGDLVAGAYEEVRINGEVTGDVTVVSGRVVVTGTVTGSLRAAAGSVLVEGSIGEDLLVTAYQVSLTPSAVVGRDILVWAVDADSRGLVGRNLEGQLGSLSLGGEVLGRVEVTTASLAVPEGVVVAGDLIYESDQEAILPAGEAAGGLQVSGNVIRREPLPPNVRLVGARLLVTVLAVIAALGSGLMVLWLAPRRSLRAVEVVRHRPLRAFLTGLAVAAAPLVIAGLGALVVALSPPAAGLPLLVLFIPLVLAALAVVFAAVLATPLPVAAALGGRLLPGRTLYAAFVAGFVLLVVAAMLPWVGGLVLVAMVITGLGGWTATLRSGSEVGSPSEQIAHPA